jgi:hypothetical protein
MRHPLIAHQLHDEAAEVDARRRRGAAEEDDLHRRIDTVKHEVDALQIHVMRASSPWYRQLSTLVPLFVSVAALLFSFATTYISESRVHRQETHATRAELRSLIQRLTALPKENLDFARTYANDPNAVLQLTSAVNTENNVLASQATELISELPGDVTATEYYAVAYALITSGLTAQSEKLLKGGLEVADDVPGETALLRQYASLLFSTGDITGGRARWQQAMEIFRKYPERNPVVVASTHAFTQMAWADAELNRGQCPQARRHIGSASAYIAKTADDPLKQQVSAVARAVEQACGPAAS